MPHVGFRIHHALNYDYHQEEKKWRKNQKKAYWPVYEIFLEYNFVNFFQKHLGAQNARLAYHTKRLLQANNQRELPGLLKQYYARYITQKKLYDLQQENEKIAQIRLELAQKQYELGRISPDKLSLAQCDLKKIKLKTLETAYKLLCLILDLRELAGKDLVKGFL